MVKVPVYEGGVSTRPIHQQGVQARAIEGAFGGGQGLVALAQGMGHLGKALQEARDLEDMTRAKDAENEFALYMQGAMYGEGGYMYAQGRQAFEGRAGFMEQAEKKRREIAGRLKGGAQKSFNEASTMRMLDVNGVVLRHAGSQQKAWVQETSQARAQLFAQDALNAIGNEDAVNKHIAAGVLEIRAQGELDGLSGEALALKEKAYISSTYGNVVLQMAARDPIAAQAYLKVREDLIDPQTRFDLEQKLEEPVLRAQGKGDANNILLGIGVESEGDVKNHGGGVTSRALPDVNDIKYRTDGTADYMDVAGKFLGMHERQDGAALAAFLKRAGGVSIDPKVTPWCAAFVNAVLNEAGMEGTGKLNARSFLNFGQATDRPKVGDIVVLSRGDPNGWQGHVGFFHGFDDKGNVLVLGGNQGDKVSIAPFKADQVLGFRTVGRMDGATMALPNYQIGGLGYIEEQLAKIADPRRREIARAEIERQMTARKKAIDAARDEMISFVDSQLETYPQMDLNALPLEMRNQIGAKEMQALRETQKKVLETGGVVTDEHVLFDLQMEFADDPLGFADVDLWQYRDKLSRSDWKRVVDWQQKAREDRRKGMKGGDDGSENLRLAKAMTQAKVQLAAVGIDVAKVGDRELAKGRIAQFQTALGEELEGFITKNKRPANEREVDEIINKLLLPMVVEEPGWLYGTNKRKEEFLFELRKRQDSWTVRPKIDYENIPVVDRLKIERDLEDELGREPTREEVYLRWFGFKAGLEPDGEDDDVFEAVAREAMEKLREEGEDDSLLWKILTGGPHFTKGWDY